MNAPIKPDAVGIANFKNLRQENRQSYGYSPELFYQSHLFTDYLKVDENLAELFFGMGRHKTGTQ